MRVEVERRMRWTLRIPLSDWWQLGGAAASIGAAGWLSHQHRRRFKTLCGPALFAAVGVVAGTYPATAAPMDRDMMMAMLRLAPRTGAAFLLEDGVYFFVRCFDWLDPNLRPVDHLWYCCIGKCRRASPRRDDPGCQCASCRDHWSDQHRPRCTSRCGRCDCRGRYGIPGRTSVWFALSSPIRS